MDHYFSSYIALLVVCYMGENIKSAVSLFVTSILKIFKISFFSLQNEKICNSLTNLHWYYLPMSQQKDIAHMLNRMQNGVYVPLFYTFYSHENLDYTVQVKCFGTLYING